MWSHGCPVWLPTSEGIIKLKTSVEVKSALVKVVKVFEDTVQVQLIKERWEEIKTFQTSQIF